MDHRRSPGGIQIINHVIKVQRGDIHSHTRFFLIKVDLFLIVLSHIKTPVELNNTLHRALHSMFQQYLFPLFMKKQ